MAIDIEAVGKIAHLARLTMHEQDKAKYAQELTNILALADELLQINTTGVEPLMSTLDVGQRFRPDVITETNQRDALQACAPKTEAGLYLVPQVIE
jgi:aspartyl-tRNA(Asn)/glutamyl-tRNA(Gln) amidotransferase subunit C